MKILNFDSLPSTNDYAKNYKGEEDILVTALRQTAGRGSKNRTFDSGMGGVYLTKLTHYADFPASEVFKIMLSSSVAVCRTLEDFSILPAVKWPNDVYVNGKKICGILIENTFSGDWLASSVVGIGVNVNNVLPPELCQIATTMSEVKGYIPVKDVRDRLIFHLSEEFGMEDYKKYIFFLGQEVYLVEGERKKIVTALEIDPLGRLVVRDGEEIRTVTAGEVSFRFLGNGEKR